MLCDRHLWTKPYVASLPSWLLGWTWFTLGTSLHSFPLVSLKGAVRTPLPEETLSFRKKIALCDFLHLIVRCLAGVVSPSVPLQIMERGRHLRRVIHSTLLSSVSQHGANRSTEVLVYHKSYREDSSVLAGQPSVLGGSGKAGWLLSSGTLPKAWLVVPGGGLGGRKTQRHTFSAVASSGSWGLLTFPGRKPTVHPKRHSSLLLGFQLGAHIVTLHNLAGVSLGPQPLSHSRTEQ